MGRDARAPGEPRELRLEGAALALAGGALLALLVGAFQLGRSVERWSAPAPRQRASGDPLANLESQPSDGTETPTFFDTVNGTGKEAEPSREAAGKPTPAPPAPVSIAPGPWFVQVFVGRDRAAAEDVVRTLREKGYAVRADAVAEGRSGSLYKVRVGGYPTKEAAETGAEKLRKDGQAATWVVRLGT